MKSDTRLQYFRPIQDKIGYAFKNIKLLQQALTHRSYSAQNNERFEFIGDSILDYVVAKMLYDAFPNLPEGRLSPLRAQLVKEATLAEIARELGLGNALYLGMGELKSGGNDRASILADAMEALFAAISFDADFHTAENVVRGLFADKVRHLNTNTQAKDAKTRLQEWLQGKRFALPKYRIEKQTGEGNDARFDVSCDLGELGQIFYAQAHSRRAAEQECAQQALAWLEEKFAKKK
ncbi:ribonuclease III [Kingella negevensis]|uniref:Ribonuclease 3 n=1 Tax=Kingella negevensis TaxID=1522312 RepID=A0A238HE71_9NEIS|nr:ribonuclease III [Kingella negevensis]MDK4680080.1 ribonuclease III [Kingella negevensis]MDK4682200.1 ribonuclease III [Kingella negevensis]MDK4684390.1 ribonuclease III [Kingella negevensis]MDK4690397.1 ribonuclease III [Kingella negevensis]MDK4692254.1 ribonuclease III [Kingella negevensis]